MFQTVAERPLNLKRPTGTKSKEPKVKYKAPEPPFEVIDYYSDDILSPSKKYLDLATRSRSKECQFQPIQFAFGDFSTFGDPLRKIASETPPPLFDLVMAEGYNPEGANPINPGPV